MDIIKIVETGACPNCGTGLRRSMMKCQDGTISQYTLVLGCDNCEKPILGLAVRHIVEGG